MQNSVSRWFSRTKSIPPIVHIELLFFCPSSIDADVLFLDLTLSQHIIYRDYYPWIKTNRKRTLILLPIRVSNSSSGIHWLHHRRPTTVAATNNNSSNPSNVLSLLRTTSVEHCQHSCRSHRGALRHPSILERQKRKRPMAYSTKSKTSSVTICGCHNDTILTVEFFDATPAEIDRAFSMQWSWSIHQARKVDRASKLMWRSRTRSCDENSSFIFCEMKRESYLPYCFVDNGDEP